jgi:hypothetical protein
MRMTSVATSNTRMKGTGPLDTPRVLATRSPAGRSRENENPVPAPAWCSTTVVANVVKIDSRESSNPNTKHADRTPTPVPAFISVGEFGRNSSARKLCENRSAHSADTPAW